MSLQAWYNPQQSGHGLMLFWPEGAPRPDQGYWYAYSAGDSAPIWLAFGEATPAPDDITLWQRFGSTEDDGAAYAFDVFRFQPISRISPAMPPSFPMGGDVAVPGTPVGTMVLRKVDDQLQISWRIQRQAVGSDSTEVLPSPLPPDYDPDYVTGETRMVRLA